MDKVKSLKEWGYYLDELNGRLYLLEGTDHLKTLLFDDVFKKEKTKDSYELVIVDMPKFTAEVIDAYISKKDYRTIVYPLYRGSDFKFIYRGTNNTKKIIKKDGKVELGGIRCKVYIDKENIKDARVMANDVIELLDDFITKATDISMLYDLRVNNVLLNTLLGGSDLGKNTFNCLLRYFSAMCVEGDSIAVTLYFKQRF